MMQNIRQEIKTAIIEDTEYLTSCTNKDPEKCWQALEKKHNVESISAVTQVVEMTTRKNYHTIKPGGFETLKQFSGRFRALYKAYIKNGGKAIADELQAAPSKVFKA